MNHDEVEAEIARAFTLLDQVNTPPAQLREAADIIENALLQADDSSDDFVMERVIASLRQTADHREAAA